VADAPEVRERRVVPERGAERRFIEFSDAVGRVLRRDVERDFREIEIRPNAARRRQAETALDFTEQKFCHFLRRQMINRGITRDVDERLVHGVDEDVVLAEIVEITEVQKNQEGCLRVDLFLREAC